VIHALLASALPLAWFFGHWLRRGRRTSARAMVLLALACAASSAWAVIPDMPRLVGKMETYVALHHRWYCNAWWLHCYIDAHDDIDSSMVFPALFVLAAAAVFTVGWRELARREAERAAAPSGRALSSPRPEAR
jgi:hypothetical protein